MNFEQYTNELIKSTFGFEPLIRVEEINKGTYQIFLDGEENQRKMMMGRDGRNLKTLKEIIKLYARRFNVFVFVYIEFKS